MRSEEPLTVFVWICGAARSPGGSRHCAVGSMAAEAEAGADPASAEWEAPTRLLRALTWLGQEFASDWEAQDLRAALFQLLLLWLVVSLLGIQVAWRVYGNTVTSLYYRQGTEGQNGETSDGSSPFSMWESTSNTNTKTHRE
ncbi:T-cell leukemia translocation-altered gene protein [Erythrolamprus reginae]|uniref:T-cell leukemia translocation-altered gene protein n=1 Tax=Erythrolamprus reginae TaxID=121349 RepID=UPI00396CD839